MKTIDFTGYKMTRFNFDQINYKIVKELIRLKMLEEIKVIFADKEEIVLQKKGGIIDAY